MIGRIFGRLLTFIFLIGLILLGTIVGGSHYIKKRLMAKDAVQHEGSFIISRGTGTNRVISSLEGEEFISGDNSFLSDSLILTFAVKANFISPIVRVGEYNIPQGLSLQELMAYLSDFKNAIQHQITFPEGWRSSQILERLKENPILTGKIAKVVQEGRYLPNTWSFERGDNRQKILDRMHQAQNDLLDELWNSRAKDLPIKNRYEAIILASIVERETALAEEQAIVASVYINRLKQGMKLDADPTVAYGAGKFSSDEPLTRKDIQNKNNPYNTYQYKGLPPGPIANPGQGAIKAVLNPEVTNYLFFVANGEGGHVFSKDYKDHQNNVLKWRKIQKDKK